jgi:hypothetical protein
MWVLNRLRKKRKRRRESKRKKREQKKEVRLEFAARHHPPHFCVPRMNMV